jgi:ABC-type lipoprotein release transport system permease subunit
MATLLFKTGALDVLTFSAMTLVLLTVSTVACLVPAWRASRLDPNETLRQL